MEDYEVVYAYLNSGTYPTGFSKNQRRALRRKCLEHFKVSAGTLYFSSESKSSIKEGKERKWKTAVRTVNEKKRILEACHSNRQGNFSFTCNFSCTVITKFLRLACI